MSALRPGARRYDDVDAERLMLDPQAIKRLDPSLARRHGVAPIAFFEEPGVMPGGRLLLGACRVDDPLLREAVQREVGDAIRIDWCEASVRFVAQVLSICYPAPCTLDERIASIVGSNDGVDAAGNEAQPHVVALVDTILRAACCSGASDIHLSPAGRDTRLRFRTDGRLVERARWPGGGHPALVQRLKVLALLDVADLRAPQDGQFTRLLGEREIAFRVSTFPVKGGENVVLRIQDPGRRPASLAALGLSPDEVSALRDLLTRPSGLLLLAGPTGCGKTTTLYALLGELDDGTRNLVTLEDPVEYPLEGVVQAAIDPAHGLDYAAGVRALLRQDPDVLMIGEIRDGATAAIALRAALAGHRVLATLHARDALASVGRLLDLGADRGALGACLNAVVAQRLLPRAGAPGRFPVIETLVATHALRQALVTGGAVAVAMHDNERRRVRLCDAAGAALQAGRTDALGVERVFGRTGAVS